MAQSLEDSSEMDSWVPRVLRSDTVCHRVGLVGIPFHFLGEKLERGRAVSLKGRSTAIPTTCEDDVVWRSILMG